MHLLLLIKLLLSPLLLLDLSRLSLLGRRGYFLYTNRNLLSLSLMVERPNGTLWSSNSSSSSIYLFAPQISKKMVEHLLGLLIGWGGFWSSPLKGPY